MDFFHLLEVVASEVFTSNAMGRHSRTTHYLSALATLSQALARRQSALSQIERYGELLDRTSDETMRRFLEIEQENSERDRQLAELELKGIDLWINTLSGGFLGKDQLSQALRELADEIAGTSFERIFPSDQDIDMIVAKMSKGSRA